MANPSQRLPHPLQALQKQLSALPVSTEMTQRIAPIEADLAAAIYHLQRRVGEKPIVAVLGGTGVGKSTLVNRLLDRAVSATSFRRTFTAGALVIASDARDVPPDWLGIAHREISPQEIPARGKIDEVGLFLADAPLTQKVALVDTPDVDGDQLPHHLQADRAFRWADAIIFLVTPEKYQLPDLLPYCRLVERYSIPSFFVMNKAEETAVVDDYAAQVHQPVFAIARDDAAWEPPQNQKLDVLRDQLAGLAIQSDVRGQRRRAGDVASRCRDKLIEPATADRNAATRVIAALRAMEAPNSSIDVAPITQQLRRRLQQRSVLYLIGPGRLLDRAREVPALIARLPRSTWDLLRSGRLGSKQDESHKPVEPDFRSVLTDQFQVLQAQIDDRLRNDAMLSKWMSADYDVTRIAPESAGEIVDQELGSLKDWLTSHWHATPRDTAILQKLLKVIPGGQKLTQWSEAAPYLLALVVLTHHAFFGHVDMAILGGYSFATWISERISNQVASRTRKTNDSITRRFNELATRQIEQTITWIESKTLSDSQLLELQELTDQITELAEESA